MLQVNYWPSNVEKSGETQQPKFKDTFYSSEPINGQRVKEDLFVGDDYIQAGERIRSMDEGRCVSIFCLKHEHLRSECLAMMAYAL